jgi:RNA-binding protein YhbY
MHKRGILKLNKVSIKNKTKSMNRKQEITDKLISEIEKAVEQEFDTKVNACGIIRQGDENFLNILTNEKSYSSLSVVGYIVIPVLINQKNIIINSYYETWRYNHSATRCMEGWFNIDIANKKLNDKLKSVNHLLKFIEGFTGENTASVIKFSAEPFEKDASKIVTDFDTLLEVFQENDIENCGYVFICFKEGYTEIELSKPENNQKAQIQENESPKTSKDKKSWWQRVFNS